MKRLSPDLAKQLVSILLEVTAVGLIAVVIAVVAAPVWALLPIAAYLVVVAQVLGGRGRDGR